MREGVQPKMGKVDIDYQKLHDAFFKFQTKPTYLALARERIQNITERETSREVHYTGIVTEGGGVSLKANQ